MNGTRFFYIDVRNIQVGKKLLVKGRGRGVVRGVLTSDGGFITKESEKVPIDNVLRACFEFEDKVIGLCLTPPDGSPLGPLLGWGTFRPRKLAGGRYRWLEFK